MESFHFFEILVPVADGKLFQPSCDVQIGSIRRGQFKRGFTVHLQCQRC